MSWIDTNNKFGGVYKITNIINEKCYVGSSVDVKRRWRDHVKTLNRGKKTNPKLINSWKKYGSSAFKFELLLVCEPFELLRYEQYFIDRLNPDFNICKVAGNCLGIPTSDLQKKVTSIRTRGVPRDKEIKEKIRVTMTGQHYTEERNENISKGRKGIRSNRPIGFNYFSPKEYNLVSPTGLEYSGANLKKFCEDLNIPYRQMSSLSRSKIDSYAGWRRKN